MREGIAQLYSVFFLTAEEFEESEARNMRLFVCRRREPLGEGDVERGQFHGTNGDRTEVGDGAFEFQTGERGGFDFLQSQSDQLRVGVERTVRVGSHVTARDFDGHGAVVAAVVQRHQRRIGR